MAQNEAADLEASLLARAETLAREYREAAQHRREEILAESAEHLKLREEHELLAAKEAADRLQRQRVQAAEIRLQADLDRVRWTLVQSVLTELDESVAQLVGDEARYLPILARFIAAGAALMDTPTIVVALNARDHARLSPRWDSFAKELAPGKTLQLAHEHINSVGGALLHDPDTRIRVDHSFEGRKRRLSDELARGVMAQLFGAAHG
jgi:V/A-type H+-transporting ATPase subunit E